MREFAALDPLERRLFFCRILVGLQFLVQSFRDRAMAAKEVEKLPSFFHSFEDLMGISTNISNRLTRISAVMHSSI
jgi:hypothetical protein